MLESTAASAKSTWILTICGSRPTSRRNVDGARRHSYAPGYVQDSRGRVHSDDQRPGLPSYQLWMRDGEGNPAMRVYLRKSDVDATNPPRHNFFMSLLEKYPEKIALPDNYGAEGEHP